MNIITKYIIAGWFLAAAAASAMPVSSAGVCTTPQFPPDVNCSLAHSSPFEGEGKFGGLDKSNPYSSIPSTLVGASTVAIHSPLGGEGHGIWDLGFGICLDIPSPLRGEGQGEGCATKEGRILEGHNLVWGENAGWVNLKARHGDLRIGSNILAGWIWLENCGWVCVGDGKALEGKCYSNSNSCDWGVNNDGRGNLSGYAWSELTGWINFGTSHSRVSLDKSGQFRGYAWGENVGWIQFGPGGRVEYLAKASPRPWREIGTGAAGRLAENGGGESYMRSGHVPICGLNRGSERYDEHSGILCAGVVDESGVCGHLRVIDKPVYIDYGEERDYIRGPPLRA